MIARNDFFKQENSDSGNASPDPIVTRDALSFYSFYLEGALQDETILGRRIEHFKDLESLFNTSTRYPPIIRISQDLPKGHHIDLVRHSDPEDEKIKPLYAIAYHIQERKHPVIAVYLPTEQKKGMLFVDSFDALPGFETLSPSQHRYFWKAKSIIPFTWIQLVRELEKLHPEEYFSA